MKALNSCLLTLLAIFFSSAQPDIDIEPFASGFNFPLDIENAGDDRLFVVERPGVIKILNPDGSVNTTPFLDINSLVIDQFTPSDETGLLGLAFHPNYSINGYFYVNYINNSGDTVISRFSRDSSNPDIADPSSQLVILTITQPFANHNGGDMAFGPDGFLYIATGDGGSGGDPNNYAQNLNSLLGKLLRIDVDNGTPYGIPPGNPFLNDGDPNTLEEIWAFGLRNPWRFSFDSLTGELWIADVGQGTIEEINNADLTSDGLNYGWRCYEGSMTFNTSGCPPVSNLQFPIAEYNHVGGPFFRCSITGGFRYRGADYPNLYGVYLFADFCSDEIGYLEFDGSNWNMNFTNPFTGSGFSSFGESNNGELYISAMSAGNIYKIVDVSLSIEEEETTPVRIYPNPAWNSFTISFPETDGKDIHCFSLDGRLIKSVERFSGDELSIDASEWSSGMYILEVKDISGKKTRKKIIIR